MSRTPPLALRVNPFLFSVRAVDGVALVSVFSPVVGLLLRRKHFVLIYFI